MHREENDANKRFLMSSCRRSTYVSTHSDLKLKITFGNCKDNVHTLCCTCLGRCCFGLETRVTIKISTHPFNFFFLHPHENPVNIYRIARMGRNFDDYPGFQSFRSWANTYAQDCNNQLQKKKSELLLVDLGGPK